MKIRRQLHFRFNRAVIVIESDMILRLCLVFQTLFFPLSISNIAEGVGECIVYFSYLLSLLLLLASDSDRERDRDRE
jgi:hypothetical protein